MLPVVPGYQLTEVVHESSRRLVCRGRSADGSEVILKTLAARYPGRHGIAELRREFALLCKLDIDGVVDAYELVSHGSGNLAIVMEPFGLSLAEHLRDRGGEPLPLDVFFTVAVAVAGVLGEVHEADVVHKDVVPRNILFDPETRGVKLIDFSIASALSRERLGTPLLSNLEGSLPFISPEQTGRMNRDVDYRSDLYSLGVSFFQLLTGQLPFHADTAIGWVHQHISREPPSPSALNPAVPRQVADIVLKLMSKDAEDRYQSTYGLIADLQRCRTELVDVGSISPFFLGHADTSRRFQFSQRLVGRDAELEQLHEVFGRVARGSSELCLISGWSGVGKSALVGELSTSIVGESGVLIHGKFDPFQRSTPYSALSVAFGELLRQLLAQPPDVLQDWAGAFMEALGGNGALLCPLLPDLALILGPQPPVAELPPAEAQNRFQLVFVDFVRVFTERHPLVLFLDDLQWSDAPTLSLLRRLARVSGLERLLVVGAYRSNEVGDGHPLRLVIDELRESQPIVEIELSPIGAEAIAQLTAAALCVEPEECAELSALVYDRTRGNPFFATEFLQTLYETGVIRFRPHLGLWGWDLDAAVGAEVGSSVVEFMVANLRRLPDAAQRALQLAACVGNTFSLRTVALLSGTSTEQAGQDLLPALVRNMVVPLTEEYRFVSEGELGADARYRFRHDRVQQAAHALLDAEQRASVHLAIGRLLQSRSGAEESDARLMEIVDHLDDGRQLITDPAERMALAHLNLRAAQRARSSSAYEAALQYARIGRELAGEAADPGLLWDLGVELQQCSYLTGRYDEAQRYSEHLLEHARTPVEKAEVLCVRTRQYATIGKMRESIESAIAGLQLLGLDFRSEPDAAQITEQLAAVERNLAGREIPSLIDAPVCTDEVQLQAVRLLTEIFAAAFLSGSGNLFPYLVLKLVNLSLEHGNSPESPFAYAAYGMLLCGALDDPATAMEYGRLAVATNERFDDISQKARVIYVYTMFVHHWSEHWATMTPWFKRGIEAGYQSGDLLYLAYSAQDCIIWDPTLDLETASEAQRRYLSVVKDTGYEDSYDSGSLFLQMQLNFLDQTDGMFSLDTEDFDEGAVVAGMAARGFMTGIANHQIYKAEIHHFYLDFEGALRFIELQDPMIRSSMSLPQIVRFHLVSFLTRAALDVDRPKMQRALDQMARWAAHCPVNFAHLESLMRAENARLEGDLTGALELYGQSIQLARDNRFLRDEGMANELAGRCLLGRGLDTAATGYLQAAHHIYGRFGAVRKVRQLEEQHSGLRAAYVGEGVDGVTTTTRGIGDAQLDLASVMAASQAISGELLLEQLWNTTLAVLMENAGAHRAAFVIRREGQLELHAMASAESGGAETQLPQRLSVDSLHLPVSVLRAVLRTREPVVLGDARSSERFGSDPYVLQKSPRSVLCVPIARRGGFEGVIYMENNLTTDAFTAERIKVIRLLSSQAAISTENARLYEDQRRLVDAQRRFVPDQFLEFLGHQDIADVTLGESISREMTVMFSDLRGFTPLAERLGPQQVIGLLNRYFSRLEVPIATAGGFIDSFNGDEIMALFGVSPDRAVEGGIGMWRALADFNRDSVEAGGPALNMGVGLNTGPLVLGTVGGNDRLKCGVVGDTVNLASRIEQLTKHYDVPFLIGEQTYDRLADPERFSIRQIDRVAVKGKSYGVRLYEVLDAERPERRALKERTRELLHGARVAYEQRRFGEACEALEQAIAIDPADRVLDIVLGRCRKYEFAPPPESWQGFETLSHK